MTPIVLNNSSSVIRVICLKGNSLWGVRDDVLHGRRHGLLSGSVDDNIVFPSNAITDRLLGLEGKDARESEPTSSRILER
jgi:hypothetical protein